MGPRHWTIAAIAAACAVCIAAPASAATVTATAKAKVVKPLAIESRQNLDLGTVVLGPGAWSGATIKLSRSGTLTCPANVTCSGATQVAVYNLAGSNGETIAVNVPQVTLTNQANPGQTLILTPDNVPSIALTNSGNPGTNISIGGSITLNSITPSGTYKGTFNVTAHYQ